ncbi:hypothetical protein EDB84DRAFT_1188345 [Lactarius hengduanensis]|nr:hypothetical protein EDB84DRAFT_1188345 [Lactarius hengduanensis]
MSSLPFPSLPPSPAESGLSRSPTPVTSSCAVYSIHPESVCFLAVCPPTSRTSSQFTSLRTPSREATARPTLSSFLCPLSHPSRRRRRIDPAPPQVTTTRHVDDVSFSLFSEHGYHALGVGGTRTDVNVRPAILLVSGPVSATCRVPTDALHIVALVQPYKLMRSLLFCTEKERGQETVLGSSLLLEAFAGLRFLAFIASVASSKELDEAEC